MATERNWMSKIDGNTRVSGMVMPGSHDAGVAKCNVELNLGVKESWAVCQHGSIMEQAEEGSRFFDCRVFYQAQSPEQENAYVGASLKKKFNRNAFAEGGSYDAFMDKGAWDVNKKNFRFGHFLGERMDESKHGGIGGAYGGVLKPSILQAISFVKANPTEFLILRFSHSGWPEKLAQVMKYWYEKHSGGDTNWEAHIYRSPQNIATELLSNLRGKLVMVFDGQHTSLNPAMGLHRFSKFEDAGAAAPQGLTTCGAYAATSNVAKVVKEAKAAAEEHFASHHMSDHLHFVYYQQTMKMESIQNATHKLNDKDWKGRPQPYTGGARTNLAGFLGELQAMANQYINVGIPRFANVISHDFVDPGTCRQIIQLNPGFEW